MPLIPIIVLFLAPTTVGGAALLSLLGLAVLLIAKIPTFLIASDFKTIRAALFVALACVVSVIIGAWVTIMFVSPDYILIGIILIFILSAFLAGRLKSIERCKKYSRFTITFALAMITLIMIVLFAHSIGYQAPANISVVAKIIFSTLAIMISFALSIMYEELIIRQLYRSSTKQLKSFKIPVLWANIIGILVILIAAIIWIFFARHAPEIKISELLLVLASV